VALKHWLQLALTDGIGPILIGRLIEAAGSAEAACAMGESELSRVDGIGSVKSSQIRRSLRDSCERAEAELEQAQARGFHLLCADDVAYPVLLKTIPDPPPVLYVMGQLQDRDLNAVAIVGSRQCSNYGREQGQRFGALLAGAGITVVSGGARGIDSAAHRGAMSHPQGRTLAILGCGIDVTYPPENESLFRQISQRGAVISEYPLGTPPAKENFPRRNRIISGISRGVLVVEADQRSGALITARQAGEDQGRTVFALPGRVDNPLSLGPHQLIRDGAVLVSSLEDILNGLGPPPQQAMDASPATTLFPIGEESTAAARLSSPKSAPIAPAPRPLVTLTVRQEFILTHLGAEPAALDRIIDSTDLPAQIVLQELTFLTLKGMVKRVDAQNFVRRS
jgi:DNA processing protein